jgi:hypothetical protein
LTRRRLASIRLILGFDFDTNQPLAEVEDFLREREKALEKEKRSRKK